VITLKDIALKAGVNVSTVSRALNKNSDISGTTRESILRIAAELGYRPNYAAQTLAGKASKLVGVLIPDIRSGYFDTIIGFLEEFLTAQGYSPILAITDFDLKREIEALELFCNRQVDGILVSLPTNAGILRHIDEVRATYHIPVVLLESLTHWDNYDDVMVDDAFGMTAAVEYLKGKGHTDFGFLTDETNYPIRFPMFRAALESNGLAVNEDFVRVSTERFEKGGYLAMKALLASGTRPTALLAGYDSIAIGAMRVIYEAGLRIPEDFAIVGNDNIPEASFLYQCLTTIAPPVRELARMGTELLLEKIGDPENKVVHNIRLRPELIIRETT
jgi:LacI family transcriptional regulator